MFGRLRSHLSGLLRRAGFERAMSDELRFHVESYAKDLERQGLSRAEAARRARAAFGSVEAVREDCRRARGLGWWDELRQDVGYAFRLMRRAPGFSAAVVLSLGLGIGANTAIFSLIDAVLLRTLPVANPHELYFLAHGDGDSPSTSSNYPLFESYRMATGFSGVTAYRTLPLTLDAGGTVEMVAGQFVSGNFHAVIGAPFILGRGFVAESDVATDQTDIAVISERYWVRRFDRAPDVIGRTLTLNGRPVTIVGVSPFAGLAPGSVVDITVPFSMWTRTNPSWLTARDGFSSMPIVARLRSGVSETQALATANAVFQQFMTLPDVRWAREQSPQGFDRARLLPAAMGSDGLRREYRMPLLVLMGMAALVLLVATANVANLFLARASARAREMAIRLSVGSGRARVVRQLLTESAVLAMTGGALGLAFSYWGARLVVSLFGTWQQDIDVDVSLNLRALAFTAMAALTAGVAFGIAPALRTAGLDLTTSLRGISAGIGWRSSRSVLSRGLLVAQVALSVVVLVTAALLAQSVHNRKNRRAGFDASNLLLFDVVLAMPIAPDARQAAVSRLLERLQTLPGVTSASLSTMTPVNSSGTYRGVVVEGQPETPDARGVWWNQVSTDYFRTAGVRLLHGRTFDDGDARGRQVVILNERAARHIFKTDNPVGQSIEWMSSRGQRVEVVGIVEDTSLANLRDDAARMVYSPLVASFPSRRVPGGLKTTASPITLIGSVRNAVSRVSPDIIAGRVRTMEEQVNASMVRERGLAWLSAAFATLAAILAAVGLYGMLSYQVACRTREIGIRLAIGARPGTVLSGVLRQSLSLALTGIAIGLVVSWFATGVVGAFLYGLTPRDPATLIGVAVGLGAAALGASYLPARRASRVDALQALRSE